MKKLWPKNKPIERHLLTDEKKQQLFKFGDTTSYIRQSNGKLVQITEINGKMYFRYVEETNGN